MGSSLGSPRPPLPSWRLPLGSPALCLSSWGMRAVTALHFAHHVLCVPFGASHRKAHVLMCTRTDICGHTCEHTLLCSPSLLCSRLVECSIWTTAVAFFFLNSVIYITQLQCNSHATKLSC